jgi:hypothetical protein
MTITGQAVKDGVEVICPCDNARTSDAAGDYHRAALGAGAECLTAALDYLGRGWSALALCPPDHLGVGRTHGRRCKSPGKAPFGDWTSHQSIRATAAELNERWRRLPTGNVGIVLGPVSGLVRVDVDGEDGEVALLTKSGGDLPPTLEFRSGRADGTGRGLLYAINSGAALRTTAENRGNGKQELRFQGRGSQTVLPPSRHRDGGFYRWTPGRGPNEIKPAPMPRWLIAEMAAPLPSSKPGRNTALANGDGDRALALAALAALNRRWAFGYSDWLKVGQSLHAVADDDAMLEAWDDWSKQCEAKYEPGACASKWATFKQDGGIALGSLLRWARRDGWSPPPVVAPQRHRNGHRLHHIRFTVEL